MALVRPECDEELRIEQACRDAGGPWAYPGVRECPSCEAGEVPVHPSRTDRQVCGNCLEPLPGDPVTWAIRDDNDSKVFVLRHGDYIRTAGAPLWTNDDDVNRALAGNVWLNLEQSLQLLTAYRVAATGGYRVGATGE